MNLSLCLIRDQLAPRYACEIMGNQRLGRDLFRPILYSGEGGLPAERLYVSRTDILPAPQEVGRRCLVCVGRGDARAYAKAGCCVLHIPGTGDYIRVYNEICAIFDRFDAWENALRDQLEQQDNFDYHALAVTGARMLDNTIGMSDQFLRILFTTDQDASGDIRIAEGKYDTMLLTIDDQIAAICEKEKQLHAPYTSAFNHQGDIKPYCFNIFHLNLFAACVFIYPDRHAFRDSDYEIADVFFRYFAKAFIKYIRTFESQESPSARVVRTLLLGQPLSREERHMLALDDRESWILFRLCQREGVRSMPPKYIQATIASLMPRTAHINLDGDDITGILKVQADVPLESCTSFASFRSIVSQMGYAAGLSNPFRDLNAIGEYRFQADYALRFLRRTKKDSREYCCFNDCVLDYMLSACCANLSLESLFSRQFRNLLDYDREHGTALAKTLEHYLRNEMNLTETARELYLHRSSLIKRLDRIKQLLECDLTNPNLILYYRMCFELLHRTVK